MGPHLCVGEAGIVFVDEDRLAGGIREQLGLAAAIHRDEPPDGLVDRLADGEQAVVAQDRGLAVTRERGRCACPPSVEDDARVVVEEHVVVIEGAGVLGDRVEEATERRPRFAVHRVAMRRCVHIGTGGVDLAVDRKGRSIDDVIALDDLAVMVHEQQVRDADQAEVLAERVHPEVVAQLRVAGGDVPRRPLVISELRPEAERGGEPLLAVEALLLDGREHRWMPMFFCCMPGV